MPEDLPSRAGAPDLGRVLTAMITPMREDGGVDLDGAGRLAAFLVENGNDGVVVCGTTGESPTLSRDEKLALLRAIRAAIPGRPIVMGTGGNDTATSIALSREALAAGADAVMAVVPYYNRPPQSSLYHHFKAIADAIDGPLMMYNVPSRTASNLAAETSIRLSEVPNIVALKEAVGDLNQPAAICAGAAPGFRVYSGDDSSTLPMLALGAHGVVSVAGHLAGPGIQAMIAAFLAGDTARAASLHHRLMPIFNDIFRVTSPIPIKALVGALGLPAGPLRPPLYRDDLDPALLDHLVGVFHALGDLGARLPAPVATG
jgi:4-hydroxy-tetrahydrodipicolinate synthase